MTSTSTPTPGTHGSRGSHEAHHVLHGADHPPVQSVTDVPSSPGADRADRARRYLTAMGLRGLCFVGAIIASGWLRWTFVAGAVVLPYVAVVLANAVGPGKNATGRTTVAPRTTTPQALTGTVVEDPLPGERVRDAEHPVSPDLRSLLEGAGQEPELLCSAKGCRERATTGLRWNNPRLHDADRRKVWLACNDHVTSLSDFLSMRGFLRDAVPVAELESADG